MKKLYLFLLAVIFISLTACTTDNEELIIWSWNQNVAIMKDAVSKYKEINPTFNAKVESFSQGDIQTKFISAKELNQPENLADIMLIDAMNLNVYYDQWPSIFYDFSDKVND